VDWIHLVRDSIQLWAAENKVIYIYIYIYISIFHEGGII
jgi:hypothetical protein